MQQIDIAWAAGFYEGEGHLSYRTGNGGPLVVINQCNKEPLDKLQALFGGQVYGPKKVKGGRQDVYIWNLTKHTESRSFIYSIFPYLSDKKQKDTLDKIDRYADYLEINRAYCRNGHYRTEKNTYIGPNGHRRCRSCRSGQQGG